MREVPKDSERDFTVLTLDTFTNPYNLRKQPPRGVLTHLAERWCAALIMGHFYMGPVFDQKNP